MIRRLLQWVIPAILVAVLFFGCGQKPGEELYYDALAQWEAGNRPHARTLLEKSINRRAGSIENADAYNRLGLLLWEMDKPQEAVDAFRESLRVNDEQYDVRCNLGVALCAVDHIEEAEAVFREAIVMKPEDPRPLAYAGIIYAQNGKWQEAYRNLSKALQRNPNDRALQTALALVELQLQNNDPTRALRRLQQIVDANPSYEPALFNLASAYRYKTQNLAQAKLWYERYLEVSSGIDAFSALARKQIQALNSPTAIPKLIYRRPTTRDRAAAQNFFAKAVALHRAGQIEDAIRTYTLAIEADDTYERAFYNLGLAYYANGEMALAGQSFSKAVELNPAYTDARYNLALVSHYNLGDTPRALSELNMLLSQKPDYQPAIDLLRSIRQR